MASPIVKKVLARLEGERELKILESNNEINQPQLWARAKELAEERHKVYSPDAHGWAIRWYQQKGGVFEENKPDYLDFDKDGDEKESMKKALKDKKKKGHDCASKVKHEEYGIGNCIKGMHTLDEYNKVTHYDVEFEEYIVENVPVDHLEILEGMYHEHAINHDKNREVLEHHQKDADGNVIPHGDGTPSSVEEAATTRIPAQNGNVYELMYSWRGKTYFCKMFFPQQGKPSKDEVQAALTKVYPSSILRNCYISSVNYGDPYIHAGAGDGFTDK